MWSFGPELIQAMCAALDKAMTSIPADQATPALKMHMAEFILRTAAEGQTSYEGRLTAASAQIQTLLTMLT
jgi:hypothetical protein